ncbi:hypothetical protein CK203_107497 [Vitis vinifera]|uniref:Integrase catalytic domain-containing protein n=1 Tax=Vitis vinifera TaxID=29760 RepID=A0A438CIR9_VITVI|nr:hypothetical protein CK203_107497 [Vitis vinifera]
MINIPADATVRPLLIESRFAPAYCCLIDDTEIDDGLPWYHDIYHFLRLGVYPEAATGKDKRALRQASTDRVMREVHAGVCGPHMGGHMISPKSSSGHEFILVTIDYFTKWVEAASYARLTSSGVASFIISHIIYRYGVPHELISDRGIPEADWAQARFDQLNLLDERRLRAADHVRTYQRKMACAFKRRVKPRPLRIGDLVLKVIKGLIRDPRGKFKPNWSGPYFIRELTLEGATWLMDLDGNRFSEPTNVDQLKRHPQVYGSRDLLYMLHFTYEGMDHPEAMGSDDVFGSLYLDRSDSVVFKITGIMCLTMDDLVSPDF